MGWREVPSSGTKETWRMEVVDEVGMSVSCLARVLFWDVVGWRDGRILFFPSGWKCVVCVIVHVVVLTNGR